MGVMLVRCDVMKVSRSVAVAPSRANPRKLEREVVP